MKAQICPLQKTPLTSNWEVFVKEPWIPWINTGQGHYGRELEDKLVEQQIFVAKISEEWKRESLRGHDLLRHETQVSLTERAFGLKTWKTQQSSAADVEAEAGVQEPMVLFVYILNAAVVRSHWRNTPCVCLSLLHSTAQIV